MRYRMSIGLTLTLLIGYLSCPAPAAKSDAPPRNLPAARAALAKTNDSGDDATGEDATDNDVELTLERIFPKKSFFGPRPSATSFSHDGRFGAFLYRPFVERRHGSDLYVIDTASGQVRRMTNVGRMAEFQNDSRKVREDREKRAKKAGITPGRLAAEQAMRMGWSVDAVNRTWTGEAEHEDGERRIAEGDSKLTLRLEDDLTIAGSLTVGFVQLELEEGRVEDGSCTAQVSSGDEKLGAIVLTLGDDEISGVLTLDDPAQKMTITLRRDAEAEAEDEPRGVLGAVGERLTLGDVVLDDDADINDEKNGKKPDKPAPRYGGIQSYEWSPNAHEMLVMSGGDVYRLAIDLEAWQTPIERPEPPADDEAADEDGAAAGENGGAEDETQKRATDDGGMDDDGDDTDDTDDTEDAETDDRDTEDAGGEEADADDDAPRPAPREPVIPYRGDLTRLTQTRERERDLQYLPDGSGYTYLRDGALLRVSFGDHTIMQLDPELEDKERMVGYRISPDQQRLVFLANRGDSFWSKGRKVTIVNYRDRFARTREVTRHMPDDPWPEVHSSVYLYDLTGHEDEDGTLERVFTRRLSGPRDIMRVPEWSPDSSRIAFAAYDQASGRIRILEAGFVTEDEEAEAEDETPAVEDEASDDDGDVEDDRSGDGSDDGDSDDGSGDDGSGKTDDEERPSFEIENAKTVYQFLHAGGPNTPRMIQPQYLPDSRRMVFITELSGYRQLHLLDPTYEQLTQLTEGRFEVYPFDLSEDHETIFATATKDDPNQEHIFAIDTETGAMRRLSTAEGVYESVAVSDDGAHVLATRSDFGAPRELVAIDAGGEPTVLTDSHPKEAHLLTSASPEYFTYENRHGQTIHGHMFRPADWTPEDERPLLIYVYGGPLGERKMATRGAFAAPSYFFARYMAEHHGYVTATIDPRGASGYGAVFEKANFEQVGKPQTEDLVDGARWLAENHGVDEDRMALHGWSFGGFQTQMVMYTEPDVFAAGIAGAGPTEWHNYNSWYSTGTIGANEPGKTSLEKYSLLPLAKDLKGKLLLVHGMEDSNVLYQDTVRVYRELLKADKEVNVELFLDPTGGHGLGGDVKTIGRYRKYEDFLVRHLGEGEAAPTPTPEEAEESPVEEDGS